MLELLKVNRPILSAKFSKRANSVSGPASNCTNTVPCPVMDQLKSLPKAVVPCPSSWKRTSVAHPASPFSIPTSLTLGTQPLTLRTVPNCSRHIASYGLTWDSSCPSASSSLADGTGSGETLPMRSTPFMPHAPTSSSDVKGNMEDPRRKLAIPFEPS